MAIQLLSGLASLKAGKDADVNNKLSFVLADADAVIQVKDVFASLLASADSKDERPKVNDLLAQPDASAWPLAIKSLSIPVPVSFNATVPLELSSRELGNLEREFEPQGLVQSLESRPVSAAASASVTALVDAPSPNAAPVQAVAPFFGATPKQSVSPALIFESLDSKRTFQAEPLPPTPTAAPSTEVRPKQEDPVSLGKLAAISLFSPTIVPDARVSVKDVSQDFMKYRESKSPALGLDIRLVKVFEKLADAGSIPPALVITPLAALLSNAAPVAPLPGQVDTEMMSPWAAGLPLVSSPNKTISTEVRTKTVGAVSLAKSATTIKNFSEGELHLGPLAAQSSLDEAGRKNEALIDLLAHGDRLTPQESPAPLLKPAVYVFQREADNIVSTHSHNLSPSRTPPSESLATLEKNSYWAANGTHNVALTLEGLGDESVAVKISLSGVDTRIDIRTDHLALRQMIEGTVQTMKEQLSTEGLTLSGLSVGTPGQDQSMGQSGGQASQSRPNPGLTTAEESGQSPVLKTLVTNHPRPVLPKGDGRLSVFA